MTIVDTVRVRTILDSRGNPTVEADVITESGGFGRAAAPSGASTGANEAIERPADEAVAAARELAIPRLEGHVPTADQRAVDAALRGADGTDNFAELGANAAIAISMAAAKAAADVLRVPLYHHLGGTFHGDEVPIPIGNVIGGGEHAVDATNIQEFHAIPVGAPSVTAAVFANAAVHNRVGSMLHDRGYPANKGDEGAWAPQGIDDTEALKIVTEAVDAVAHEVGFDLSIGLDVAATELFDTADEVYHYDDGERSRDEQLDFMESLVDTYDIVYLEDPLEETDFEGFAALTDRVGDRTFVCGDDLFCTNPELIDRGIEHGSANAVLIKPNQIGTLSDAVDAVDLTRSAGHTPVVSHRSGETEDTTIAHFTVATGAPFIKTGAVGGERTCKLNELIRISQDAT